VRVLLIEDDTATAQSVEFALAADGMQVRITDLGQEGIDLGRINEHDIILLSVNLPDMCGFDTLRALRAAKVATPIMMVTGLGGAEAEARGFGLGADDYLIKPFHKDELVARIRSVVRRTKP
jgi:two-component system, cell cycle response regulator CtrA